MLRKKRIRIISFVLAAFAVVSGIAIYQYSQAMMYKTRVDNSYRRAFYDLVDYVKNIDTSLEKGIHSSSPNQMALISTEVWRQSQGAKASLGQLPLNQISIEKMEKFLSQVGDYSYTLSKKAVYQDDVSDEEQKNLEELSSYAKKLTQSLLEMEGNLNEKNLNLQALNYAIEKSGETTEEAKGGFGAVEKEFHEYPSLIYNGPFSDHIEKLEPQFLKGKKEVTAQQAKENAAKLIGLTANELKEKDGSAGVVPTFSFEHIDKDGGVSVIEITRSGGFPLYILSGRTIGKAALSYDDGVEKAKTFLADNGFGNMQESYYIENEGILYVNFAFQDGDYTVYPDLVEVGVALDNGGVVFMQSRGYIMNHKTRDIPSVKVSRENAQAMINKRLTPQTYFLAVIPTDAKGESYVHAFKCVNKDGRRYMVFINTQTGREEEILMLIESDKGTLTM